MVKNSAFKKADLHVHTPKSSCYSDQSVTPEQIVDATLAADLEVIAVTDHNTVEAIDEVRRIAKKKGLFVFPGVELSTKEGHITGIFDLDTSMEELRDFLGYAGIARGVWGDASIMAGYSMEELFQKIEERGGVGILAHIERWPSGFLESTQPRRVKMRIHNSKHVCALEITVPHNKELWNDGRMRGYQKKYACIQGSDAHALEDIGRRPVYIQMESVSLENLQLAFREHEARIVFPNEFTENN